jgi:hypothetical protein
MFRIRDILERIRTRILGSKPLTDIRLRIRLFSSVTPKTPTKDNFLTVLKLFLFKDTFTSFFKEKVIKKSQNSRNQGFSSLFCLLMEGSGSVQINYGSYYKHIYLEHKDNDRLR